MGLVKYGGNPGINDGILKRSNEEVEFTAETEKDAEPG